MRTIFKSWYVAPLAAAAALGARPAAAQIDIDPPLPNVLLLIDTSGSMERLPNGDMPSVCNPSTVGSPLNRWGTLVSVLTGTINDRRCYRQSRNHPDFLAEYGLGGNDPYDAGYKLPHHRILSGECVIGPGTWPDPASSYGTPERYYEWPNDALIFHKYDDASLPCDAGEWSQEEGLLDDFKARARFGLMTFDAHTDAGTGSGGPADLSGPTGLWSYFDDWESGGTPASGNPDGCGTVQTIEVGARNPLAPPWEGRLISPGQPDADNAAVELGNEHIQQALLALRPYGATPLAGMMEDAYTFLLDDDMADPFDATTTFAPAEDPYFQDGCRNNYVIVLSDGEPNLDLRGYCSGTNCPFREPWEVAYELANPADPDKAIKTFAVGFGLSAEAGNFDCDAIDPTTAFTTDTSAGGCVGATGAKAACCTLTRIAYWGGTERAYFADDETELRAELSEVLAAIASGSTSRTMPSFASASASAPANAPAKSYEFASSFLPHQGAGLWEGVLERKRWVCTTTTSGLEAELAEVDPDKGDVFSENVNSASVTDRRFITVVGTKTGGQIYSERTIRPNLTSNDGLGTYSGTTYDGPITDIVSAVQGAPEAMGMATMPSQCSDADLNAASASDCAGKLMTWNLGGNNGTGNTREGAVFGAIYHSSPVVIGKPGVFLRDETYAVFAESTSTRPLMLYTATTDGQLHGFKVASNDPSETSLLVDRKENNELWSFIPPYVLPNLLGAYPSTQKILLDGQSIVKDVVYERTQDQAKLGSATGGAAWNTVLVASGGAAGGFYYAVDVTDPTAPEFLWQLSTDDTGAPLFSDTTTTPAIATIAYEENDEVKEIAVAILPGGEGEPNTTAGCTQARQTANFNYINDAHAGVYRPRSTINCWNDGPARSLTIVRLSDGEVLASFRGKADDGPHGSGSLDDTRVRVVDFDSPIVGTPVPFPSQTGDVADRIYVGDADGTIFRVDLTDPDSAQWDAHLLFDAYALAGDALDDGEPVEVPPVVSTDGIGNAVIVFATGDQETFNATATMKTRVWSVTELALPYSAEVPFQVEHNWVIPFTDGKRVTGPIALFDEAAYFATFTPVDKSTTTDVCTDGYGSIWGVDFMEEDTATTHADPYPEGRLAIDPNDLTQGFTDELAQSAGVIVFGVAVTQVPSCYETEEYTDSWSGGGTYTAISSSSPPTYQLVYQTGTGGTASGGATTRSESRVLPPLSEMARIDSWASIIE